MWPYDSISLIATHDSWFSYYAQAGTQLCTIYWRILFSHLHTCMRSCIIFYGIPSKDQAFSRSWIFLYCGMCSLFYLEWKIVIRDSDWRKLFSMLKVIRGPIVHLWCHYHIYSKLDLHLDINSNDIYQAYAFFKLSLHAKAIKHSTQTIKKWKKGWLTEPVVQISSLPQTINIGTVKESAHKVNCENGLQNIPNKTVFCIICLNFLSWCWIW